MRSPLAAAAAIYVLSQAASAADQNFFSSAEAYSQSGSSAVSFGYIIQLVFSLAVVFGFIYLAAKYFLPKLQPGIKGKYLEVTDKLVIEPSVTAYILKTGKSQHTVIIAGRTATVLGKVEGDLENAK